MDKQRQIIFLIKQIGDKKQNLYKKLIKNKLT